MQEKRLNLRVRGPGEKPFLGVRRSNRTESSYPGQHNQYPGGVAQENQLLVRPIPSSHKELGEPGERPPGWSTYQLGPGLHTL